MKQQDDPIVTKSILQEELEKYATKKDLQEELEKYATKKDLQEELEKYATKKDLQEELKKALSNYPTSISVEIMIEKSEARSDEKARQYRNEILTVMDKIVGELAQIREDRLFENHEKRELQEQIDGHEKRIKKLEKRSSN